LRNFGLKVGIVGTVKFEARIKELVENLPDLAVLVEPLLMVRRVLREQFSILHRRLLAIVRDDEVCRRLSDLCRDAAHAGGVAGAAETKADNSSEGLARALSQPPLIPHALRHEFQDIVNQTVRRLRSLLHQGELTAYYFGGLFGDGRHAVSSGFWATTAADGVMESGTYWPFGKPTRRGRPVSGLRIHR